MCVFISACTLAQRRKDDTVVREKKLKCSLVDLAESERIPEQVEDSSLISGD